MSTSQECCIFSQNTLDSNYYCFGHLVCCSNNLLLLNAPKEYSSVLFIDICYSSSMYLLPWLIECIDFASLPFCNQYQILPNHVLDCKEMCGAPNKRFGDWSFLRSNIWKSGEVCHCSEVVSVVSLLVDGLYFCCCCIVALVLVVLGMCGCSFKGPATSQESIVIHAFPAAALPNFLLVTLLGLPKQKTDWLQGFEIVFL